MIVAAVSSAVFGLACWAIGFVCGVKFSERAQLRAVAQYLKKLLNDRGQEKP